jgi:type II secretory pathway pseudopilin PulG
MTELDMYRKTSFSLVEGTIAMVIIGLAVATVMSAFHSGLSQIRSEKQRLTAYFLAQEEMERLSDHSMCRSAAGLGANTNDWNTASAPTAISYNAANGAFVNGSQSSPFYYNFNRTIYVDCPYLNNAAAYGSGNGLLKGVTIKVSYSCGIGQKETCYVVLSSAIANNVY